MSSWDSVEVMSNQYSSTKSWRTVLVESRIGRALKVSLRVTLHFTRLQLPLLPLSPVTWLCSLSAVFKLICTTSESNMNSSTDAGLRVAWLRWPPSEISAQHYIQN